MTDSDSDGPHEQEIVEFELIGNRHPNHDMNTMVELTSFQSLGRMQPFNVTMSSSAMAVIDVHAHLSTSEVVGYLAGQWDVTNHNLIVSHALPVRCRLGDGEKGSGVEKSLYEEMEKLNLSLVGWYHTHPFSPPLPTLRDIDSQLEYEMKMKGSNDASYTPCIGIIVSPYVRGGGQGATTSGFWVMPPPEHKPQEYGRPMSIQFTIVQDAFIPKDALVHMRKTVRYYKDSPDSVIFTDIFQDRYTYWDKLKTAIKMCVPKEHFAPLIDYIAKLLELKNYVSEANAPPTPSKPKTPVSVSKGSSSPEVVPAETSVSSTSIPNVLEVSSSEVVNDVEPLETAASPDSICQVDSVSEILKVQENSSPAVQQMEVSFSQEPERSPKQESPKNAPESEPKEEFQPITYREQSPPPYQPPPYQPQFHPPPYHPPKEDKNYEEQKQDLSQQKEFYQDEYRKKQQETLIEYEAEDISEEPLEYSEPPPDYHQQHFTISSSTFEPPRSEPYVQEDPKTVNLDDESLDESVEQEEENHGGVQFPESISSDPWTKRLSDTLHQPHSLHQQSSHQSTHQLHEQPQPVQLLQQSQSLLLHQQSQQRQQQLQPQDLPQQSHSQDLHTSPQPPQLHQQQSESLQLHQQSLSIQLHQQSQSLHLHPQSQPLQLHQKPQLHQPSQPQQIHHIDDDDLSRLDVIQPMDIDGQISQSQN